MSRFSNSSNFATNTVSPNGFTSLYLRAKQGHLSHLKCVVILPFLCGPTCCLLWKCNTKAAKDVANLVLQQALETNNESKFQS